MEKISAVQIGSEELNSNYRKVEKIIYDMPKTDVIVLPEVWTTGWCCRKFTENAEELKTSRTINFLSRIAKDKNANIIGGSFILKKDGKYYNTCPVINRNGDLVALYDKCHLYSYYGCDEGKYITPGKQPVMVELDNIKFGLTICYDIRFPEIYRAYRLSGADVIVNCAAWASTKPVPWDIMTRSRAVENQIYMVAVNQCGKLEDGGFNLGHSRIIDYNGNILSEITDTEGFIQADLDLDKMYEFRNKCLILNDIKENYEVKTL